MHINSLVKTINNFKMPYKDFNLSMLQATSVISEYFIIVHSRQLQFSSKHILTGYEWENNYIPKCTLSQIRD